MRGLVIFFLILMSCSEKEAPPYQMPNNARLLLTGDADKTWKLARRYNNDTRMNMGDCFLSFRQTFGTNDSTFTNSAEHKDCGPSLFASWKFVKDKKGNSYIKLTSDQIPEMMNQEQNHKLFKVLSLEEDQLVLQFYHKQFSDKTTSITDVFVPQDLSVKGREFHW